MNNTDKPSAEENSKVILKTTHSAQVRDTWDKALSRCQSDPEGAITSARTLIESTCKFILDFRGIEYKNDIDLPKLYTNTAQSLKLAPSQQTENIFKQILGNCQSIVESIGAIRNKLGDAHGRGQELISVDERHAILAVELAGAMATYLIKTHECQIKQKTRQDLDDSERQKLSDIWLLVATEESISDPGRLPYSESLKKIQRKFFSQTSIFIPEGEIFHFLVNLRKAKKLPRPKQEE